MKALNLFINDLYRAEDHLGTGFSRRGAGRIEELRPQYVGVTPLGVWAHIVARTWCAMPTAPCTCWKTTCAFPRGLLHVGEPSVTKRVFPELFESYAPLPVDDYPTQLYEMLAALSPRNVKRPTVAVLTPGIYNSAYFEHAYLAMEMGAELVEGRDLFVDDDDCVYMRTVSGPQRVDVIYRRIDDEFMDPEAFREDLVLGGARPAACVEGTQGRTGERPGAGVADDKVVYAFVPEIIRYYLDEEPGIPNVPDLSLHVPRREAIRA